jgi:hypothetical protein
MEEALSENYDEVEMTREDGFSSDIIVILGQ